ncbi:YpoC family protein [Metabacillus herbersteinensis]|uniref:YpoC family protein n=1 Tax=Metabacillus herbersteinensis TaxID=283816 RepID=A0ABV6GE23_9BACI
MENKQKTVPYEIPAAFRFEPFFERETLWKEEPSEDSISAILLNDPFYFDMRFEAGILDKEKPWERPEVYVPIVFEKFNRVSDGLKHLLKRKKMINDKDKIIQAISFFLLGLYWINKQHVNSLNREDLGFKKLTLKPVNCEERLLFILQNPARYHSFIQLQQLGEEISKLFYKQAAIANLKKH